MTKFYAISDESHITASRHRSIAAISLPVSAAAEYDDRLRRILVESDVAEFKWNNLRSAKRRFCAQKLIDSVLDDLLPLDGRVDVVVWDTQDTRHSVRNRDDDRNFERMYFHLHKTLMRRRPKESEWHLRPDEKLGVDWSTLQDCLASVGSWRKYYAQSLLAEEFSLAAFHVRTLCQVDSFNLPLCQLADLFAGMAAYTRTRPTLVAAWSARESGQGSLLLNHATEPITFSSADRERLQVVLHLNQRCKDKKLGVSLKARGYLHTPNPANPINFWCYIPQSAADQAPTKDC